MYYLHTETLSLVIVIAVSQEKGLVLLFRINHLRYAKISENKNIKNKNTRYPPVLAPQARQ